MPSRPVIHYLRQVRVNLEGCVFFVRLSVRVDLCEYVFTWKDAIARDVAQWFVAVRWCILVPGVPDVRSYERNLATRDLADVVDVKVYRRQFDRRATGTHACVLGASGAAG